MLLMSLRFIFLAAVIFHIGAGLWFGIACTNMAFVKKGEDVCDPDSWAIHPSIISDT